MLLPFTGKSPKSSEWMLFPFPGKSPYSFGEKSNLRNAAGKFGWPRPGPFRVPRSCAARRSPRRRFFRRGNSRESADFCIRLVRKGHRFSSGRQAPPACPPNSHFSTRSLILWKTCRDLTESGPSSRRIPPVSQAYPACSTGVFRLFTEFTFFHPEPDFVENPPCTHGGRRKSMDFPGPPTR